MKLDTVRIPAAAFDELAQSRPLLIAQDEPERSRTAVLLLAEIGLASLLKSRTRRKQERGKRPAAVDRSQPEIAFFESSIETKGDPKASVKLHTEDLTAAWLEWCHAKKLPASAYGLNLGAPLRGWLRVRKLVAVGVGAPQIEEFIKEGSFKAREPNGKRREYYRGIWLVQSGSAPSE